MRISWLLLPLGLFGCEDAKLDAASRAIESSADDCLLSVRDKKTKYETTPACVALSALASSYIEAGGERTNTPPKYELRFVSAQRMAWTALAMSESCSNKALRIW